jgi:hypothetical protein
LDFIPAMFGKSSDLNGRSSYWSYLLALLHNSGRMFLGGGLRAGFISQLIPEFGVDNGYMNLMVEFGYLGAPVILALYGWVAWAGLRLIAETSQDRAGAGIQLFPLSFMITLFTINITEDLLLKRDIVTVLVTLAVALIMSMRRERSMAISRTGKASFTIPAKKTGLRRA